MRSHPLLLLLTCAFFSAVNSLTAQTWTQTTAPSNSYAAIASSADGTKLIAACGGGDGSGPIYLSTNSGATWTPTNFVGRDWASVASSADGTKLFAGESDGSIHISTNSGGSWSNNPAFVGDWRSIACSADGTKIIAPSFGGPVYMSTNTGQSWSITIATNVSWLCAASSADGNTLAVGRGDSSFKVYTSTNGGATWMTNTLGFYCNSVTCSADGTKMAATCLGSKIYISTNSGATWSPTASMNDWQSIASSADGTRLSAVTGNSSGEIFTSTDSGNTWQTNNVPGEYWNAIASSADGGQLVAAAAFLGFNPGPIYISQTPITPVLNIAGPNGTVDISWLAPSTNFILQNSADLNLWTDATNPPALNFSNLHNEVLLVPSGGNAFYRLSLH